MIRDERNSWAACCRNFGKQTVVTCILLIIVGFTCGLAFGVGVDWFLAAVMGVAIVLLFVVNFYLVVTWADPLDQTSSVWQTILVVTALSLAQGAILCLPLDVANNANSLNCSNRYDDENDASSGDCGNLDMALFWEVVILMIFVYVVMLLPMAIFQYEAWDEVEVKGKRTDNCKAFWSALYWEMGVLFVTGLTLALMYIFLGTAEVPVAAHKMDVYHSFTDDTLSSPVWDFQKVVEVNILNATGMLEFTGAELSAAEAAKETCLNCATLEDDTVEVKTSFPVYVAALTGFVGWFIFVVFAGIGLASCPGDLIRKYMDRPVILSVADLTKVQKQLQQRTNELLKMGHELKKGREDANKAANKSWLDKRSRRQEDRRNVNQLKQMTYLLESDFESWHASKGEKKDYNFLYPYVCLVLGVLAALLTLLWVVHLALYVLPDPPLHPFLNEYFLQFDTWFPLFGVLSVALFAGYLLVCVIFGIFKVGVRLMCMTLHPMRYGKTLMNAFMFNTMWILLCAIPVVQFCTEAFDSYARYTTIGAILGVQVKYLKFFRYFFENNVFVYCLLGIFLLTTIVLGWKPKDEPSSSKKLKAALVAQKRGGK